MAKNIKNYRWQWAVVVAVILFSLPTSGVFAQQLFFQRIYDESLSQASYMIGDREAGEVIVIDPKRDIDTYLEVAEAQQLAITRVTETHIHADYLSGSRELAAAANAELLLSAEGGVDWQYEFAHTPLRDGDRILVGKIVLDVLHMPGHTPESIVFLVTDPSVSFTPQKAITGDFIFVGDVGRPDLLEKSAGQAGSQESGARQLYSSIQRFSQLPDELEIWPGHGAGSFCGKSLSNIPQSTLAEEKSSSEAFQFDGNEQGFIDFILEGQPEPPTYFAVMKHLNKVDRPLLIEVPKHPVLTPDAFRRAQQKGLLIIDTRDKDEVARGYLPGSLHFEGVKSFSTWMGSLIDYQQQLVLIADEEDREELTRKLMRIGMDNIYGFVTDVHGLGGALEKTPLVDIDALKTLKDRDKVQLVDVRMIGEFGAGHIPGAENIPLSSLEANLDKVSRDKPVIVHCQTGVRAAMAYSILKKNGFDNVSTYFGGMQEWLAEENEVSKGEEVL